MKREKCEEPTKSNHPFEIIYDESFFEKNKAPRFELIEELLVTQIYLMEETKTIRNGP